MPRPLYPVLAAELRDVQAHAQTPGGPLPSPQGRPLPIAPDNEVADQLHAVRAHAHAPGRAHAQSPRRRAHAQSP